MAAAVAGLVFVDGKLLLVRRGREPSKGMLDLPGGFVDLGESAEAALAREIKEELNIAVKDIEYFGSFANTYLYKDVEYQVLDVAYLCRPRDMQNCRPGDDVADFALFEVSEIEMDKIAFVSTRNIITRLQAMRNEKE